MKSKKSKGYLDKAKHITTLIPKSIKMCFSFTIGFIAIIFLYTLLINKIIVSETLFKEVATNGPWINYYGSIFSGLISGFITIVGVYLTLNYYMDKDEKDERIKHIPYIRVDKWIEGNVNSSEFIIFNLEEQNDDTDNIKLCFTNIGLGTGIDILISKFNKNKYSSENEILILMPGESLNIIIYYDSGTNNIEDYNDIILSFKDIHNNTYEQSFTIDIKKFKATNITKPKLISKGNI